MPVGSVAGNAGYCYTCSRSENDPIHATFTDPLPAAFTLTHEKGCFVYHDDDGVHLRIKKTHTKRSLELLQLFLNNFIAQEL